MFLSKFIQTFVILSLGVSICALITTAVLYVGERIVGAYGVFVVLIVMVLLLIIGKSYLIARNG